MKRTLKQMSIREVLDGFKWNDLEGEHLKGMGGNLIIQPAYQRNYVYEDNGKDIAVLATVVAKTTLHLLTFVARDDGKFEVLDGQQRLVSIGKYITGHGSITIKKGQVITSRSRDDEDLFVFSGLPADIQNSFLDYKLNIEILQGTSSEIINAFERINITGTPLNNQEMLNAVYAGNLVTALRHIFNRTNGNAHMDMWKRYIKGNPVRQDILKVALEWYCTYSLKQGEKLSDTIKRFLSKNQVDESVAKYVKDHFDRVLDWIRCTFGLQTRAEMKSIDWGLLHKKYETTPYCQESMIKKVDELYRDEDVRKKSGVYEYVLGGCVDDNLLNVRAFDKTTKITVYENQTQAAKVNNVSNCPFCERSENEKKMHKIYKLSEMDADHIISFKDGGRTVSENCQMLCSSCNKAKGRLSVVYVG